MHDGLNATIMQWWELAHGSKQNIHASTTVVFAAISVAIAALTLLIVTPTLLLVEKSRNEFLKPFMECESESPAELCV